MAFTHGSKDGQCQGKANECVFPAASGSTLPFTISKAYYEIASQSQLTTVTWRCALAVNVRALVAST